MQSRPTVLLSGAAVLTAHTSLIKPAINDFFFNFFSFWILVGLGLSFKIQDWIWIAKYDSPLISHGNLPVTSACRTKRSNPKVCELKKIETRRLSAHAAEVIGVTFFDSCSCPKNVTPAPAPRVIGNFHSDSSLHSENLEAMFLLPLEAKTMFEIFCLWSIWTSRPLSWF